MKLSILMSPKKITRILALIAAGLTLLSFVVLLLRPVLGKIVELFSVGGDRSVPAEYSALLMLFCSVLLAVITLAKWRDDRHYVFHWGVLSLVFLYLFSDQMLVLHNRVSDNLVQPMLDALGYEPTGFIRYPWVLLYGPLVIIFALAYLKFWLNLPSRIRLLFLVAGGLFVGGGLIVEMFNARFEDLYGTGSVVGSAMIHFEELLEMLGPVVFAYALMSYINSALRMEEIIISIGDKGSG